MSPIVSASLAAMLLFGGFVFLVWRLLAAKQIRGVDPDWLKSYSVEAYRPLSRLLDEGDIEFLKRQPGYERGLERRLRRQRVKVFRMYLARLKNDFYRLHYALRLLLVHAPVDAPDLAKALIRQKFTFLYALLAVQVRLQAYSLGLGHVDVRGLVETVESVHSEIRTVAAASAA